MSDTMTLSFYLLIYLSFLLFQKSRTVKWSKHGARKPQLYFRLPRIPNKNLTLKGIARNFAQPTLKGKKKYLQLERLSHLWLTENGEETSTQALKEN